MRLFGIPDRDDVKTLTDLPHRVGRADDLELARRLDENLDRNTKTLSLSPLERDLIPSALVDWPYGLAELRGTLAREIRDRQA